MDSVTVTAAITAGFGGGGGAGGGDQYGEWHVKREQSASEPEFIDIASSRRLRTAPTRASCSVKLKTRSSTSGQRAGKNTFANEHVEFATKLGAAIAGTAGTSQCCAGG
ncbi:hypothetical protein ACRAWD_09385 [Caulobacter segnis]